MHITNSLSQFKDFLVAALDLLLLVFAIALEVNSRIAFVDLGSLLPANVCNVLENAIRPGQAVHVEQLLLRCDGQIFKLLHAFKLAKGPCLAPLG
jgi:hypothetical protein